MPQVPRAYYQGEWVDGRFQIFYDGAWHDPCDGGSKNLWVFVDGEWQEYPCGKPAPVPEPPKWIYFQGYGDPGSTSGRVQKVNSDGSIDANGNYMTAFTRGSYAYHGIQDWRFFRVSRDYSKVYAARWAGTNGNRGLYFGNGSSDVGFVFSTPKPLPAWLEFEVAFDGALNRIHSELGGEPLTVGVVQFNGAAGIQQKIQIIDVGATGAYNAWSHDWDNSEYIMGHVEQDRWHTIRLKTDVSANSEVLTVDGDSLTLAPDTGGTNTHLWYVWYGLMAPTGNWMYAARIKVGSTAGGNDYLTYAPFWDGYPWQDSSTPGITYGDFPDQHDNKGYSVNMDDSADIDFDYPSFSNAEINPPSGHVFADEIWEINTDGTDSSSTDTPGWPGKRMIQAIATSGLPSIVQQRIEFQVTGHGLDALTQQFEAREGFSNTPVTLLRYDLGASSWVVLKDGRDFTDTGLRYSAYAASFSPSGDKIGFAKSKTGGIGLYTINRDGTGFTEVIISPGLQVMTSVIVWNPLDETEIFWLGAGGASSYYGLNKGHTNGTTPSTQIYDPGFGHTISVPRFSPDGTVMGFVSYSGSIADFYTVAPDGTGLTNVTNGAFMTIGINNFSWSPDGSQIATIGYNDHIYKYDIASSAITDLTPANYIHTYYPGELTWFHGWQNEIQ